MNTNLTIHSCGVVPLSKESGQWKVLLVSHRGYEQYWSCPKGHLEPEEPYQEAAQRELKEETNLEILHFLQKEPLLEELNYTKNGKSVFKRILFFIAEVKGTLVLQKEELSDARWFTLSEAIEKTLHPEGKTTLQRVQKLLQSRLET